MLVVALVAVGTWLVAGQVAVYLVSSELERRANTLEGPARFLAQAREGNRSAILQQMAPLIEEGLPGFEAVGGGDEIVRYPSSSKLILPAGSDWNSHTGYLRRDGRYYCYSLVRYGAARALLMAPIDSDLLGKLVPGIGMISLNRARARWTGAK